MTMHWLDILVWGFAASTLMVLTESAGLWLGLTRLSTPIILGSVVCDDRDRAALVGAGAHLLIGWVIAIAYALAFHAAGFATWWLGALFGIGQTLLVLGIILPAIPAIHPRMASPREGPTPARALQSPGFLGLHYGRPTLLVSLVAHGVYGVLFGALYTL